MIIVTKQQVYDTLGIFRSALIEMADEINTMRVELAKPSPPAEAPTESSVPPATSAPAPMALTFETVRAALAEKSRAGHTEAVRGLLEKHGAAKLSEINPENYAALLADAEALQ